ncbi:MAG TPA: superoxide dismutase, partial [Anaerolineae bacterium]|nr:superoxide dismutase [Anaerolineae bacterium]
MTFELPSLPYADTALEPYYSARTFSFHHGKHHKAYVDNLNKLLPGSPFENSSLEEIILAVAGDATKAGFFNNAAQVWNHTFFWNCMTPGGGGAPSGTLAAKIDAAFGSYEKFAEQFKAAAVGRFGSGWAWLVLDGGELKIMSTPNAET